MKSLFKPASAARTQAIPDRSSPDPAAAGATPAQVPDAADENAALANTWLSARKMHWVPLIVPLMAVMVLVSGMVVLSDI